MRKQHTLLRAESRAKIIYDATRLFIQLRLLIVMLSCFWGAGISSQINAFQMTDDQSYAQEIASWDSLRLANLKSPEGWLNLAGLFWLQPGVNSLGAAADNDIVFLRGPANWGVMNINQQEVRFIPAEGLHVSTNGQAVEHELLIFSPEMQPTPLIVDSMAVTIISRGGRIGIRLRDYKHPRIEKLDKIDRFEPQLRWKIEAKYLNLDKEILISVPDVLGDVHQEVIRGILEFTLDGTQHRFYPITSGSRLFIIFADETNGIETYGAGRFLYTELPDDNNRVILDFNKAYNPPCAFSPYATCPLPPQENKLPISITAGEKRITTDLE